MGTLSECGDTLSTTARGALGVKCTKETAYSFTNATAKPSTKVVAEFCASANCDAFLKLLKKAVPNECVVSTAGGVRLYRDIINPISVECAEDSNTPTPTPSSKTPSPSTVVPKPSPSTLLPPAPSTDGSSDGSLIVASDAESSENPSTASPPPLPSVSTSAPAPTSPTSLLLTSSPSATKAAIVLPSPTANTASSTARHERLDVNLLLVVIACGVAIVAIVGFIAFYFDQKRNREQQPEQRDSVAVFASTQLAPPTTARDSYDHFSPRPMWAKLNSQGQICL